MEIWQTWLALGLLLIIIELFMGTFDFLALGLSAVFTGILVLILQSFQLSFAYSVGIFLILGIAFVLISRMMIVPKFKKSSSTAVLSTDKIIGEKIIVQLKNNVKVVYYDGIYRVIKSDDEINPGDTVEILEIRGTILQVKKMM